MFIKLEKANLCYLKNTAFEAPALVNVDLNVKEKETVGIIGPIGSGKSSLGQAITGLLSLDSGKLAIGNKDVPSQLPANQVFKYCNYLFQKPEKQLFESNIYEEVAFALRNLGLEQTRIESRIQEALAIVGLDFDAYKDRSPLNLSGGEMRRVAIASILAIDAPALVLDEPTAGLDFSGKKSIIRFLKQLKGQKTLIFISHDLDEVLKVCDRIIVLNRGKIIIETKTKDIETHFNLLDKIGLHLPDEYRFANELRKCGYKLKTPERLAIFQALKEKLSD